MQMEMEAGGTPLFFDLFVAMVNHLVSQSSCITYYSAINDSNALANTCCSHLPGRHRQIATLGCRSQRLQPIGRKAFGLSSQLIEARLISSFFSYPSVFYSSCLSDTLIVHYLLLKAR
jgi:hypothetical protein